VGSRQHRQEMILGCANGTLSGVCTVLEGRHLMKRYMLRLKEGGERDRRLIVKNKVCAGKRVSIEEGKDFLEGRDVCRRSTSFDR
jgi:hypothetical protein